MAKWSVASIGDLSGRNVVVTGANSGLGLEITRILAGHGARVIMACRNPTKADAAAASVRSGAIAGSVEVGRLDLASLASIDEFSAGLRAAGEPLHLLVNNAGLMAVDESRTEDGFETQFGVNHLGHVALTAGLMPLLWATPGSRVVSMSSMGHRGGRLDLDDPMFDRRGYQRWPAYFQSKLANLLFIAELHRRLGPDAPVSALAAHPGGSHTDLGHEGSGFTNQAMKVIGVFGQPPRIGALGAVRAGTDPAARGGEFYGPKFMVVGPPVLETPSRRARNADDARALWDLSERLCGRTIEIPPTA